PAQGRTVSVPVCDERRGNPVAWSRAHFAEILALEGDRGARDLLDRHAAGVIEVPVDDAGVLRDVDTLQEWEAEGSVSVDDGSADDGPAEDDETDRAD
ncbi:MAG: NTP transferase domain-containing protein, partial [Gemmatimonadetes bacterium]|nr:NTP transferase domain-containing protein [Gemmatimonadota bacterium]